MCALIDQHCDLGRVYNQSIIQIRFFVVGCTLVTAIMIGDICVWSVFSRNGTGIP